MRSNKRLQHVLATRQLGGSGNTSIAYAAEQPLSAVQGDLRLFALTFACGFLFTSVFIA